MNRYQEIVDFIAENDVKFIRLSFVDADGVQKNVSVMADRITEVLEDGVVFDGFATGFMPEGETEYKLYPDVSTLHTLPWRPQHGRVARFLCDIKDSEGKPFPFDLRSFVKAASMRLNDIGLDIKLGTECEFSLFKTDENGEPTLVPQDKAGYFDIAPLDKGENVRREICLCLEEMGITPLSSHHEKGNGQNEIDFVEKDIITACDNFVIFKAVVKALASNNGLYASFMPKPIDKDYPNGLALSLYLTENGKSIFGSTLSGKAESFIAGILDRATEMNLFFNYTSNSYKRLNDATVAKSTVFNSNGRNCFARIVNKNGEKCLELRTLDSAVNIYLAVALIINAGVDGVKSGLKLESIKEKPLAKSLGEAVAIAEKSGFLKAVLGEKTLLSITKRKLLEAEKENDIAFWFSQFERI